MMNADCFAFMSSLGWVGGLMPLTFLLLAGLGIVSLTKYLFSRSHQGGHA